MLYLALVYHMHQPYYKNLLTQETDWPWVRLHGIKDYMDMVQMLERFPSVHVNFNLVPSLLEQIEDYSNGSVKDRFLNLSFKPALELDNQEKQFLLDNFFSINKDKVISIHPRYYELYLKKQARKPFVIQDFLDLQVWFNLAWVDPSFRQNIPELRSMVNKARFFTEEDKLSVLEKQIEIMKEIIPCYRKFIAKQQIEVSITPYYHPILPLLYNTNIAKEANIRAVLPKIRFSYPQDALAQINTAVDLFKTRFGAAADGMWPSEQAVSEHILPLIMQSGVKWILTDEAILFKSLKHKKRDTSLLYQPHLLKREEGELNIIFRDRNLSDLIGFVYHGWRPEDAVNDLMKHLNNIAAAFSSQDILVTIAMDGENAWEYYTNDGHDFLELLYLRISESKVLKTVTVSEYLNLFPTKNQIKRLAAGSWINGDYSKWIGNAHKLKAWECLAEARKELENTAHPSELALKQMYILEGSDWFWWYGEDYPGYFDRLFRMHLCNFYRLINKQPPEYLVKPLAP